MVTCKQCGLCCHFLADGKYRKCKHLIKLGNGKTLCRIYNKRLGTIIYKTKDGQLFHCIDRMQSKVDYPGCPYNTGKPIQEEVKHGKY